MAMLGILNDQERTELIQVLGVFITGNPARLAPVITEHHLIRIQTDPRPAEYAFQVIRYCELSAWVEDPALIIKLLSRWQHLQIFADAISRIKSGIPPKYHLNSRPWDTILVASAELPFLNRRITRQAIEYFSYPLQPTLNPAGIRALVVRGPQHSGKKYTLEFLRYVNSFLAEINFRTISVDVKKQATSQFGPLELTRALLNQINPDWVNLGVTIPELDAQQPARWTQQMAAFIAEQISVIGVRHIIVLYGLDNKNEEQLSGDSYRIPSATIDMINQLTDIATGKLLAEESGDLLRMVLLGFDHPVTNYKNRIRVDEIKPLTADDIRAYFKDYARFYGKEPNAGGLEEMVDAVLENDDLADPFRTKRIAQLAIQIAFGVFNS